ncbi:LamG domain-containing protein [Spirilliplanes yamanashiensis]|uniref:LamG-like jellyroll fold domain-containing protein n=1 Tax=Spirilliplanes yamanashiensis TaxID=42233 RepID=A0A8J3YD86_9ACTN|nr:LamG domain-containing protein [Spirilliplanes yamanashiensis]MDP9819151.1 hypothetical protein [Spirilliplanes yamanashiensis]GIJ05605.1 hypothetical protein Sya03_49570 [Spirilliplanes yamanashiensis]
MRRDHGRDGRAARRRFGRARLLAPALVLAVLAALPATESAFVATTDGTATLTSASAFKTYPQSMTGDAAQLYHRLDEAPAATAPTNAADSSGFARTGRYGDATDGASTHYPFDDGAGSAARDVSGAANAGTIAGGATWGAGMRGGALNLNGSGQFVTSAGPAVNTAASFSVAAWVRLTAATTGHYTVVSQDGASISGFFLQYQKSNDEWAFQMRSSDSSAATFVEAQTPAQSPVGRWVHLAGVYDATAATARLYVNGTLADSRNSAVGWASAGPLVVGGARWNGNRSDLMTGQVDDVRTYRRALTGPEIGMLVGPATWWDFDAVSTTVADASGNGNPGAATSLTYTGGEGVFNGTSSSVAGAQPAVHTDRSFSVAASVRLTGTSGLRYVVSQPGTTTNAFTLGHNGTSWQFTMTGADTAAPATVTVSATTAASTALTHLVAVYNAQAAEMRLFVNGRLEKVAAAPAAWDAGGGLTAGRARTSSSTFGGYLAGNIGDLRVYDRVLSSADALDLALAPLARWDMDERGAVAADGTGNGNGATRAGATSWSSASHHGGALELAGTTGYAATASNVLDTSASYSVSAWAYLTATGAGNRTVISQDGASRSAFFLQHYGAEGMNHWAFQVLPSEVATGIVLFSTNPVSTYRWTHLVAVYDDAADTTRLYVDGVLQGSAAVTADRATTGRPTVIGAGIYDGDRTDYFPGKLDEIAAYQRVLTQADVTALYEQAPDMWLDADENAGTVLGDRSGHTNSGTMSGTGATWTGAGSGVFGTTGIAFDGASGQVVTSAPTVRTDTDLTVSAWVRLGAKGATRGAVSQNGTAVHGFFLGYDGTADRWAFRMQASDSTASAQSSATGTASPPLDTWTHLTGVYDDTADVLRLYVNGALQGSAAHTTDWHATGATVLGYARWSSAPAYRWSGRVDEVRTYGRALRDEEVKTLHAMSNPAQVPQNVHLPALTAGVPGALQGAQQGQQASTAVAFGGAGVAWNPQSYASPAAATIEAWFRVSPGAGGTLAAFSTDPASMTTTADRLLYVDSGGRLTFGVAPGGTRTTIRTDEAVDDGDWHHVAASYGTAGMKLAVDGVLRKTGAATSALAATGYWRWGGANLALWPNRPVSDHLTGTLDEAAIFSTQLNDQQIARHYAANH